MLAKFRARIHGSYVVIGVALGIIFAMALAQLWGVMLPAGLSGWPWLIVALVTVLIALLDPMPITLLLAVLAGGLIANYRINLDRLDERYLESLIGQTIEVVGMIAEDPSVSDTGYTLRLTNFTANVISDVQNEAVTSELSTKSLAGVIYAQVAESALRGETPKRSDVVFLEGEYEAGFGTFVGSLYRPSVTKLERATPGDWLLNLRETFAEATRKVIESPAVDLGLGYVLGVKSTLPEELQMTLQTVGLTHIVVASGANLSILVDFARKKFGKISRFAAWLLASVLVVLFVCMVGFSATMVRAGIVSLLSLAAWYFGRQFLPSRILIIVAAITLFYSPTYILDVGWQLSFAAFAGILVIGPKLTKFFYEGRPESVVNTKNRHLQKSAKKPNFLTATLIESAAASILCLPILIYVFGQVSLISLVANLFILPTIPYAMAMTFFAGLCSLLSVPILTTLVAKVAEVILNFNIATINFFGEQTSFLVTVEPGHAAIFWLYVPVIVILGVSEWLRRRRVKKFYLEAKLML